MSFEAWLDPAVLLLGAFLAAFVTGTAGFADAMVASAVWLQVLTPVEAVPLIVACGVLTNGFSIWHLRGEVRLDRLWPFLLGALVGVPLGAELLRAADPGQFRFAVGIFLVSYGAFMLSRARPPRISGGGRAADGSVGVIAGVMGGAAGLSGTLPTIWCGLRPWSKAEQRGVYQPFILVIHTATLGWFGATGFVDRQLVGNFLLVLPALALGVWLGLRLYRRIEEARFRRAVLGLLLISGVSLLVQVLH